MARNRVISGVRTRLMGPVAERTGGAYFLKALTRGSGGRAHRHRFRLPAAVVRKAYRDAVLRFHPDRQREASMAQRVRAEEAFKLITSLYLPT